MSPSEDKPKPGFTLVELLLEAAGKPGKDRGFTRAELEEETGLSASQIYKQLRSLQKEKRLGQGKRKTFHYGIAERTYDLPIYWLKNDDNDDEDDAQKPVKPRESEEAREGAIQMG